MGKLIEFKMSRWSKRGWGPFIPKFHEAHTDPVLYGTSTVDEEGVPTFDINSDQLENIILKATQDVFSHIDKLLETQQRMILDYCVWYREKYSNATDSYEQYIQLVACHCVVHSEFLAGNMPWVVVPFEIDN